MKQLGRTVSKRPSALRRAQSDAHEEADLQGPRSAPETLHHLQRTAGNQAVLGLLQRDVDEEVEEAAPAEGPHKIIENTEGIMRMLDVGAAQSARRLQRAPIQRDPPDGGAAPGPEWKPAAAPAVNFLLDQKAPIRQAGVSSATTLKDWSVKGSAAYDSAAKVWRYQAEQFDSSGEMQFYYLPESGYPAPTPTDDSGQLSNEKEDNWKTIAKTLHDTRTGYVSNKWRAYKSVRLHEDYHWEKEWQPSLKPEITKAMVDIRKLSTPATKPTGEQVSAAAAKAELEPKAKQIFSDAYDRATAAYAALGDSAGDPPYIAQAPAHDALETRVRDFATGKKWS